MRSPIPLRHLSMPEVYRTRSGSWVEPLGSETPWLWRPLQVPRDNDAAWRRSGRRAKPGAFTPHRARPGSLAVGCSGHFHSRASKEMSRPGERGVPGVPCQAAAPDRKAGQAPVFPRCYGEESPTSFSIVFLDRYWQVPGKCCEVFVHLFVYLSFYPTPCVYTHTHPFFKLTDLKQKPSAVDHG